MGNANDEIEVLSRKMKNMSVFGDEREKMWDLAGWDQLQIPCLTISEMKKKDYLTYQLYMHNLPSFIITCPPDLIQIIRENKHLYLYHHNVKRIEFTKTDGVTITFVSIYKGTNVIPSFSIALPGKTGLIYYLHIFENDTIAISESKNNWNVSWDIVRADLNRDSSDEKYELIRKTIRYQCAFNRFRKNSTTKFESFDIYDENISKIISVGLGISLVLLK